MSEAGTFRVLVVEDDVLHWQLLSRALREANPSIEIVRVRDGEEAMEQLGEKAGERLPDLVLLDLKLPKKSGLEVLSEIKQSRRLRPLPVVILTTSSAPEDRRRAAELHANSYLIKPVDFRRFERMVAQLEIYWRELHLPIEDSVDS
ncbi:MAG: response regulator [Acidobacteriota bacterium]